LWAVERFNIRQIKMETDRTASENSCQKPAGRQKRVLGYLLAMCHSILAYVLFGI